jgi:hypothetical protein
MSDYLKRACELLKVDESQVVKHREEGDEYVVLVDYGIAGTKKHRLPLAKLKPRPAQAELVGVVPGAYNLSYRELQAAAKEAGIPANQPKDDLIAALTEEEE